MFVDSSEMASKGKGGKAVPKPEEPQFEKIEDEQELESLYAWVDSIPLSRPKRNIGRDFSDGVLVAEIVKHFFPADGLVELHNYTAANSTPKKKENWYYLNRRVFARMNFELAPDVIDDLVMCKPGMIEKVLLMLQVKITRAQYARGRQNDKPEADQHLSPGRKDGKMIKVEMDSSKGSRFVKTKQDIDRLNMQDIDNILEEQKPPPKKVTSNVIPKRRPGPIVESDMVSRSRLEEREQEVLARDETIQILQAKISRLEHLLHLKDMRIDDLQNRVEATRPTGVRR